MIRVTVELISANNPNEITPLGTAIIANDGQGTASSGNYTVTLSTRGWNARPWKSGRVEGFPRQRLGGWDLLYRALRATVGGSKPMRDAVWGIAIGDIVTAEHQIAHRIFACGPYVVEGIDGPHLFSRFAGDAAQYIKLRLRLPTQINGTPIDVGAVRPRQPRTKWWPVNRFGPEGRLYVHRCDQPRQISLFEDTSKL